MSRKILEVSYISPESLFAGKHGERLSTHTHAFGRITSFHGNNRILR